MEKNLEDIQLVLGMEYGKIKMMVKLFYLVLIKIKNLKKNLIILIIKIFMLITTVVLGLDVMICFLKII